MTPMRTFFGQELAFYRKEAGLTQEQLAAEIGYSLGTVRSVEQGQRAPSHDMCRRADAVLNLPGTLTRLGERARGERPGFSGYLEYEGRARRIRTFDLRLVHGLLQTEDYARTLLRDERLIAERLHRQKRIAAGEVHLHAVFDESVLLRTAGGPGVMCAQLAHLLDQPENVTIQVVSLDSGVHPGMDGPLTLLDFDGAPTVANADSRYGGVLIDTPEDVAALDEQFHMIVARALDPDLSAEWIAAEMEDIRS